MCVLRYSCHHSFAHPVYYLTVTLVRCYTNFIIIIIASAGFFFNKQDVLLDTVKNVYVLSVNNVNALSLKV